MAAANNQPTGQRLEQNRPASVWPNRRPLQEPRDEMSQCVPPPAPALPSAPQMTAAPPPKPEVPTVPLGEVQPQGRPPGPAKPPTGPRPPKKLW